MVYYENRLLGRPRIRMLKVSNDSCAIVPSFARKFTACYASYEKAKEDRTSFNPPGFSDLPAFTYSTAEDLENDELWSALATYGGGGFVQYLSETNKDKSLAKIGFLKANRWIDRGTRLVVIDFAIYNGNLNLFCIIKLFFELPATGGVLSNSQYNTMRLIRYVTTFDKFVLGCEVLFVLFILFFIAEELVDIYKCRLSYFKESWNIINLAVIGV
ncbi:hypothetical protein PENTCL1PPCAC_13946, partial [Pristionchus entomophagus]